MTDKQSKNADMNDHNENQELEEPSPKDSDNQSNQAAPPDATVVISPDGTVCDETSSAGVDAFDQLEAHDGLDEPVGAAPLDATVVIAPDAEACDGLDEPVDVLPLDATVVIAPDAEACDGVSDGFVSDGDSSGSKDAPAKAVDRYRIRNASEGEDAVPSLEQRSLDQRSRYSGNYSSPRGSRKAQVQGDGAGDVGEVPEASIDAGIIQPDERPHVHANDQTRLMYPAGSLGATSRYSGNYGSEAEGNGGSWPVYQRQELDEPLVREGSELDDAVEDTLPRMGAVRAGEVVETGDDIVADTLPRMDAVKADKVVESSDDITVLIPPANDVTKVVAAPDDDATVVIAAPDDDVTKVVAAPDDDATVVIAAPDDDATAVIATDELEHRRAMSMDVEQALHTLDADTAAWDEDAAEDAAWDEEAAVDAARALHSLDGENLPEWSSDDARFAVDTPVRPTGRSIASQDADDPERTGDAVAVAVSIPVPQDSPPQPEQIKATKRKSRRKKALIGAAIAVAAFAVGVFAYAAVFTMNVTVNGQQHRVLKEDTIQDLINAGYADPQPGNLIAIDGSIAQEGGGAPFTATVNGGAETSNPVTELSPDAVVVIWDGADLTEEYTESTEPAPYPKLGETVTASDYYTGAVHVYTPGVDGQQLVRTGVVSGKQVSTVTVEPTAANYVAYNVNTHGARVVALTFDDGPSTYTPQVLDVLEANGAHATFFTVGNRVSSNASVVQRAAQMGNQIATHSWDHADGSGGGVNLTYMTAEEQAWEVQEGFTAIDQVLGVTVSRVFRAPGGNYYGSLIDVVGPMVTAEVGWNIDTRDWQQPGVDAIVEQLMTVQPGDVVLLHDGGGDRWQTVEALSIALPRLRELGYDFVTIDQLLAMG